MENEKQQMASPMPTLGMIFTVLAMLTWGSCVGVIPPEGALGCGLIAAAVFPSYLVAATNLLKTGDGLNGNIFSIFCCFFAGASAVSNIATWASATYGIPFPPQIGGIMWLVIGIELAGCLLVIVKAPAIVFFQVLMATIGLILTGLTGLGVANGAVIAGWLFFFVGILQLYFTIQAHVAFGGVNLPLGPSLVKDHPNKAADKEAKPAR